MNPIPEDLPSRGLPAVAGDEPEPCVADDPVFDAFVRVCHQLAGFDDRLHAEWVDGYLTAVAASWRVIELDELLEPLCGDAFARAFADAQDEARARDALGARLQVLRTALDPEALLYGPDALRLQPCMEVWDDEARADVVAQGLATEAQAATLCTGQDWALGFLQATSDFPGDWSGPRDDDADADLWFGAMQTVEALVLDPAGEEYAQFVRVQWQGVVPTRDELIDEACYAVQDLRVWWIDHPPRQTPRRVAAAPGRNDPCPCGSGRKYKKCHGANAA